MGKYLDFSYLEDTYGERIRAEVPVRITDIGYDLNGAGEPVPNIVVEIGPIDWDAEGRPNGYPRGSRVAVMRSYNYYPPNPDRFLFETEYNPVDDTTEFLYRNNESMIVNDVLEAGETLLFRSGRDPLGAVKVNSTLYIAVYVSEPYKDSHGKTVWLPWDLRGQASIVVPGNFGGQASGMDSLPRGVMTGGLVYGEHIDNPMTVLMRALGYTVDTIITDGEMIHGTPERLHPNLVLPLLRGMGMSREEEGLFSHRTVQHRLKNILYRYRGISAGKGTGYALQRYVEAATGMETVIAGPLNLLLDRSDTCPDNPNMGAPSNTNPNYSVSTNAKGWWAVPSRGWEAGYTGGKTPLHPPLAGYHKDGTTRDEWYDDKNHLVDSGEGRVIPAAMTAVHLLDVDGTAVFGTRQDPDPDRAIMYMPLAEEGSFYHLRFRFYPVLEMTAAGALSFYSAEGALLVRREFASVVGQPDDWRDYSGDLVLAPTGTRYLAWEIKLTGTSQVSLGAIQISEGGVPDKYRDPRAIAVVMDTGDPPVKDSWVQMDSPVVQMNDGNVKMDDGRVYGDDTTVDSFERVMIATLRATLDRYLLPGVGVQMINADDVEFNRYWNPDRM